MMEVMEYALTRGNIGAAKVVEQAIELDYTYFALLLAWGKTGSDLWVEYKKANKDIVQLLENAHKDLLDFPYISPSSLP